MNDAFALTGGSPSLPELLRGYFSPSDGSKASSLTHATERAMLTLSSPSARQVAINLSDPWETNQETPQTAAVPDMWPALWGSQDRSSRFFFANLAGAVTLEAQFRFLVSEWKHATLIAPLSAKMESDAYQQIISMGSAAIPLILAELRDRPDDWFLALNQLTGEDAAAGIANWNLARLAWLSWGRNRGLV